MTTLVPFTPSPTAVPPFATTFTFGGNTYAGVVTWNTYGQRWYLTLQDQSGNLILCTPLIGSPLGSDVYLGPGLFGASTLLYRADTGNFETNP